MAPARLILEGVSGSGKSSVLRRLRRTAAFRGALVLTERETFGELMGELRRNPLERQHFLRRLDACMKKLERLPRGRACLVERFHPSYDALVPDWTLYRALDRRLAKLGFKLAVLRIPESELSRRSFARVDRSAGWRVGMNEYFGGRAAALRALQRSQRCRLTVMRRTELPCRVFDTRDQDWARIASALAAIS